MIVQCNSCGSRFDVEDMILQPAGRKLKCSRCKHVFFQDPPRKGDPEPAGSRGLPDEEPPAADLEEDKDQAEAEPEGDAEPDGEGIGEGLEDLEEPDPAGESAADEGGEEPAAGAAEEEPAAGAAESDEESLESLMGRIDSDALGEEDAGDPASALSQLAGEEVEEDEGLEGGLPDLEEGEEASGAAGLVGDELEEVDLSGLGPEDAADGDELEKPDGLDDDLTLEEDEDLTRIEEINLDEDTTGPMLQEPVEGLDDEPLPSRVDEDAPTQLAPPSQRGRQKLDHDDDPVEPATDSDFTKDFAADEDIDLTGSVDDEEPEEEEEEKKTALPFDSPKVRKILWTAAAILGLTWLVGSFGQSDWLQKKMRGGSELALIGVEGQWQSSPEGNPMLMVMGGIGNEARTARSAQMVVVELLDDQQQPVATARVIPGRVLQEKDFPTHDQNLLRMVASQADTEKLKVPKVIPGKEMKFQAIFIDPPAEASRFRVNLEEIKGGDKKGKTGARTSGQGPG
ncbi:MAG: zinc-ribbon domain-containing protein [Magnetococcales bacterium]|nr:zinc-ribbon domain-containing protein [Magnetococcales bacterium]